MWVCCVQLKRASTGAWSLVPTSFWTRQARRVIEARVSVSRSLLEDPKLDLKLLGRR